MDLTHRIRYLSRQQKIENDYSIRKFVNFKTNEIRKIGSKLRQRLEYHGLLVGAYKLEFPL